jgi:Tol biopolymer transport system component
MRGTTVLLILSVVIGGSPGQAQDDSPTAGERLISGVGFFAADAARPAWSTQGDWVAYDKPGHDGYRDVYLARPDGSFDRCLTCDLPEFDEQHAGNAQWHPSGRYLVFHAEQPFRMGGEALPFLAIPGRNRGDALWVISTEGRELWKIVSQVDWGGRLHSPRFSFEGDQLAWSERVASGGDLWGDWVVRVGEFTTGRGGARVRDVRTLEPAPRKAFYEAGGFMPDDKSVLVAGNFIEGQPVDGLDLYAIETSTREVSQLTTSAGRWDRFPAIAPDGRTIAWSSSETLRLPERPLEREDTTAVVALDLWIGALDGSWSRRLTGFNDPLADEYLGVVMVGPSTWSPEGDRLLVTITPLDDPGRTDMFVVELAKPFGP